MTVKELIEFLRKKEQDLLVAYRLYSEQCLMDKEEIEIDKLCAARKDGWIQNKRSDMPTQKYLIFPRN